MTPVSTELGRCRMAAATSACTGVEAVAVQECGGVHFSGRTRSRSGSAASAVWSRSGGGRRLGPFAGPMRDGPKQAGAGRKEVGLGEENWPKIVPGFLFPIPFSFAIFECYFKSKFYKILKILLHTIKYYIQLSSMYATIIFIFLRKNNSFSYKFC